MGDLREIYGRFGSGERARRPRRGAASSPALFWVRGRVRVRVNGRGKKCVPTL